MDCFASMLIALLKLRSINLNQLASAFPSEVQKESRYRRIQRFIGEHHLDFDIVALFIMRLFNFLATDYYLALDRTNWVKVKIRAILSNSDHNHARKTNYP